MGTKLQIVNAMLLSTGERQHNTLNTQHPSVLTAIGKVDAKDQEFQSRGYWFNRDRHVRLIPDADGIVHIPDNHLSFSLVSPTLQRSTYEGKVRYVARGNKLYDSFDHTYVIKELSLYADIITQLPIEDLPPVAFSYLQALCVQEFYEDDDGDLQKASKLEERKVFAWNALRVEELRAIGTSMHDRPAVQAMNYRIGGTQYNPRWPGGIR